MLVLVLNCGSSSLKFQLIETSRAQMDDDSDRVVGRGQVERIGSEDAKVSWQITGSGKQQKTEPVKDAEQAITIAFESLASAADPQQIEAAGHRFVHGGDLFQESVEIDDATLKQIENLSALAPLHNPHNLQGYYASRKLLPKAKQVAVFDTAFHQTLPRRAYLYGIPYELYERDKVRKYGFHGTSYRYVSARFARMLNKPIEDMKMIVGHLGNGCSLCAIDGGKSVDTTMGFTPMDGLLMGTRPGEMDPAAVLFLAGRDPKGIEGVGEMLNHRAGLAGITGGTSDMRDVLNLRDQGDARARDAVDVFCYRIVKNIGAYLTILGGADGIVFTGGIGENASAIRQQVGDGLSWMGVTVDGEQNNAAQGVEARISTDSSRIPVWVIPTKEELLIARDTLLCATCVSI